jgi:hypothetical protein
VPRKTLNQRLFEYGVHEGTGKCGGCNWEVGEVYVIATSQSEAGKLYYEEGYGLCAECITDLIREEGLVIRTPK